MKLLFSIKIFTIAYVLSLLLGCKAEDGTDGAHGLHSLTKLQDEPQGINCPHGGLRILNGLDSNNDGTLQSNEVNTTTFLCHGKNQTHKEESRLIFYSVGGGWGNNSTSPASMGKIIKFDKRNWVNAKEIFYTAWIGNAEAGNIAYIEIYNETDQEVIANSTYSTQNNQYGGTLIISDNLIDHFPEKEITLSLNLRSAEEGKTVYVYKKGELIIKR